ncbi:MAG: hypothetical protein ACYSUY_17355 [Planctomycetota bacterium]|jgi:hypothetical protein
MKDKKEIKTIYNELPACVAEYIDCVIKKMRYRKKVRRDVQAELKAHFQDELKDCKTDEQREQKAQQLIAGFGDVKLLAILLRRAKKRCRSLWRKILVRSFQVVGVIILYILICFAPLVIGRPNVSVNYADWLNDLGRAGRAESENAYPYYKQAVEVSVKMPELFNKSKVKWPADFNDMEMQQFSKWLNDNNKALELMIEGTNKPHYWAVYQRTEAALIEGSIFDGSLKHLSGYRQVARALNWRSLYKAYSGEIESALDDCISLLRFGRHQEGKGLLIEQFMGVAIEAMAFGSISMIMEKADVPADTLKNIQEQLQEEFARPYDVINLEGEKAFLYDYIQRTFTDDGKGGGRMLARGAPLAVGDWKSGLWRFASLSYPDRREVTAKVDQYYNLAEQVFDETPWQVHQENEAEKYKEIAGDSFLLKILAPAVGRVGEIGWRTKTRRTALLTVLALSRYEKEKSKYPESLDVLVEAGYLKEVPKDPYSDSSLVYKKTDEIFILYSFGKNLCDDGGQIVHHDDGRIKQWASEGDWVFWPMPASQITQ